MGTWGRHHPECLEGKVKEQRAKNELGDPKASQFMYRLITPPPPYSCSVSLRRSALAMLSCKSKRQSRLHQAKRLKERVGLRPSDYLLLFSTQASPYRDAEREDSKKTQSTKSMPGLNIRENVYIVHISGKGGSAERLRFNPARI